MARKKEDFFTKAEFSGYDVAVVEKANAEEKLGKCKTGLMLAAVAEISYILGFNIPVNFLSSFFLVIALIATALAYIVGGGLGIGLKVAWKITKTIAYFGWFVVPFPADIVTGLMCTVIGVTFFPFSFLFIPLILVFCNYVQIKKDYEAADEFIRLNAKGVVEE